YLRDMKSQSRDGATFSLNGNSITFAASGAKTTFLTGTGVGHNTDDRVPIIIARRKASKTAYAWAISIDSPAAKLEMKDGEVRVEHEGKRWKLSAGEKLLWSPLPPGEG